RVEIGPYKVHFVSGGRFRLDGGAMFGVVPKVLWNKVAPADERNRIRLAMNCLLIEGDGQHVLVDTGVGTKNDPKFRDIFAVERPESLLEDLAALGIKPEDVTTVATTHLHFDHCGGGTTRGEDGAVRPTFPRAHYAVDLVPTVAHLPLPYIMGFDTHPLTTLETKRAILRDATREGWLFLLEHDPDHLVVRVAGTPERPTFEKVA